MSYTNMTNVADNTKSTKMSKRWFRSQFFKLQSVMQERKVREKSNAQDFYIGSFKHELHPISQGNPSLTLHYFKRFTKFTPLHF